MAKALDPQKEEEEGRDNEVLYILTSTDSWYNDIKYYPTHGSSPNHLDSRKKCSLRLKSTQYQLINGVLFQQNYDKVLHRCLEKDDAEHILIELHDGLAGGHFSEKTTTHKVLRAGYYLPTLFKDAHAHAQKCQIGQVNESKERIPTFPLHPITVENPFE